MTIRDVKTIYTGGGIYEYIVELDGGKWGMFDDDDLGRGFLPIVDREPTEDDWHSEFFEEHDAGYLINEEATELMREVLEASALSDTEREERVSLLVKPEEHVTNIFVEKLNVLMDEEFFDFQTDNGIDCGDLSPDMVSELNDRVKALVESMNRCMEVQLRNR